jgi:hypothetical protein
MDTDTVNHEEWDSTYNYRHLKLFYLCDVFEYKILSPVFYGYFLRSEISAMGDDKWIQYCHEGTNHMTERADPRVRTRVSL